MKNSLDHSTIAVPSLSLGIISLSWKCIADAVLGVIVLSGLAFGSWSSRAQAETSSLPLFDMNPSIQSPALSDRQTKQAERYRHIFPVAEMTVVRLRTDALRADTVSLNLPGLAPVALDEVRVEESRPGLVSWSGKRSGKTEDAGLVLHGANVVGTIHAGDQLYFIRPLGDGLQALMRLDPTKAPLDEPPSFEQGAQGHGPPPPRGAATSPVDDCSSYDVIVAYTQAAADEAGDIDALIENSIKETNTGYANSGINLTVRLAHSYKTEYSEVDTDIADNKFVADVDRLTSTNDGYIDEIHDLRNNYRADLGILLRKSDSSTGDKHICGRAKEIGAAAETAFAVVGEDCSAGYYSFGHEIGHLQGARHNIQSDNSNSPYAYGHGFYHVGGTRQAVRPGDLEPNSWRTVMSYDCPAGCQRLDYWSNPDKSFGGFPMGVAATADNHKVLNQTACQVANFRTHPTDGWQAWVSRGGTLASYPECTASGARLDCWARDGSGSLTWNRSPDGNAWAGWTNLGGSTASAPACVSRGGKIDCFVVNSAGHLARITYDGSSWGAWADLGGSLSSQATNRPSCVAGAKSTLDCYATGKDKALYRFAYDGRKWASPQKLGGSVAGRPECLARSGGIDCFAIDTKKNLREVRITGGKAGKWVQLLAGVGLPPQCIASDDKMDCFAQGPGLSLLKGYYTGAKWAKWTNVGGNDVGSQPSCYRDGTNFDCYWTTPSYHLIHRQRGAAWQAEEDLGGTVQQRPVCLAHGAAGRIDCLARGTDNSLQQKTHQ